MRTTHQNEKAEAGTKSTALLVPSPAAYSDYNACPCNLTKGAHIEQHSDRQTLVYDRTLPDEQVKCLKDWAKKFGSEIVNGIDTYRSPD